MKHMKNVCGIVLAVIAVCLLCSPVWAGPVGVGISSGGTAQITALEGTAALVDAQNKALRSLARGDSLKQGDRVKVGENAKIEIRLPDGSFVRFDAGSLFEIKAMAVDSRDGRRNINVNVVFGKIWASVSKMVSGRDRFDVSMKTTTAGVRGTVYRVNVNSDDSAIVKVYDGTVDVKGDPGQGVPAPQSPGAPSSLAPHPVAGPSPVAGPHPVSMEQWVYTLKAMQQIIIRPDGTATPPFRFSYEADRNDWVDWNRQRDADAGIPVPAPPANGPDASPSPAPPEVSPAAPESNP
ncbi:MAG: FecR family protein [Thermodesulfobacteriota bacterium]